LSGSVLKRYCHTQTHKHTNFCSHEVSFCVKILFVVDNLCFCL
jgi:hypothetical protein